MEPEQLLHSEHSSAAASLLPSLLWLINSRLVQLKSKIWGRCLWSEKAPRPADCCVQSAASVPGLFLAAPGLRCCGLLIAVAPLVAEHGLWGRGLSSWSTWAGGYWLRCPTACGVFLDQELNPCPLQWQVGSYTLDH